MIATGLQVLFCIVFYGGFLALMVEYALASRREKRHGYPTVNPEGELPETEEP